MLFPLGAVADATMPLRSRPDRALRRVNFAAVGATTRFLPISDAAAGRARRLRQRRRHAGAEPNVAYSAAKRALQTFFESLRHACADSPVRVQFYVLGYMDTERARGLRSRIPKGDPMALARRVCRDLHRDLGVAYYPRFWRLLAGGVRAVPWPIYKRVRF